jgi:hypothetical protein
MKIRARGGSKSPIVGARFAPEKAVPKFENVFPTAVRAVPGVVHIMRPSEKPGAVVAAGVLLVVVSPSCIVFFLSSTKQKGRHPREFNPAGFAPSRRLALWFAAIRSRWPARDELR